MTRWSKRWAIGAAGLTVSGTLKPTALGVVSGAPKPATAGAPGAGADALGALGICGGTRLIGRDRLGGTAPAALRRSANVVAAAAADLAGVNHAIVVVVGHADDVARVDIAASLAVPVAIAI